jgi:hypothetical protein
MDYDSKPKVYRLSRQSKQKTRMLFGPLQKKLSTFLSFFLILGLLESFWRSETNGLECPDRTAPQ